MCSSLSAVKMYFSSEESRNVVRSEVWPRTKVPEVDGWEIREVRSLGCSLVRFSVSGSSDGCNV